MDLRTQMAGPLAAEPYKRRGSKIMWGVAAVVGLFAFAVWIGFFVAAKMGWMDRPTAIAVATVGALSLEGTIWCIAAAIGVSVFEARKRIWRFLTGRSGA